MNTPIVLCGTVGKAFDYSTEGLLACIATMPGADLRDSVLRYRRPMQRWMSLLAKQLLLYGIYGPAGAGAEELPWRVSRMGRPSVHGLPDFNLSHSGGTAVCAIAGSGQRVGIDIQQEKDFSPQQLQQVLSPREEVWVGRDSHRATLLWSRKEAVSKLLGAGMSLDYRQLETLDDRVSYGATNCYLYTVPSPSGFRCTLAVDHKIYPRVAHLVWQAAGEPLSQDNGLAFIGGQIAGQHKRAL